MLCDDIASLNGKTADTLTGAERFVLKRDAVTAAVNVSLTKPSSLVRGVGLCKLPYRRCWIEWSFGEQMAASGEHGHSGRAAAMLYGNKTLDAGVADLVFWHGSASGPVVWSKSYEFDYREKFLRPVMESVTTEDFLGYSSEDQAAMRELYERHPPTVGQDSSTMMSAANQALTVMSFLMLLNSRNSVEISEPDNSRLNKSRIRSGKLPYYSHHVVELVLSKTQRNRADASGLSAEARRAHLVRGHFKVRTTGVFWWMPHLRGDLKVGVIDKDYRVSE